jgi:hypothetical protein
MIHRRLSARKTAETKDDFPKCSKPGFIKAISKRVFEFTSIGSVSVTVPVTAGTAFGNTSIGTERCRLEQPGAERGTTRRRGFGHRQRAPRHVDPVVALVHGRAFVRVKTVREPGLVVQAGGEPRDLLIDLC